MWHCFTITENLTSHLTAFLWSSISFFKSPWFTTHTSFWLNCKDPKENTTHFLTHFYVQASISAEPNRMNRMCLVHWLTNESLMGIIFAANNCTHTLFGFHTLNLSKRKAVSHTSPGLSLPMHSDSSHWVLWYSLICIFDANVVFVYGNEYL